jgi:hypothetical protein
VCLIVCLIYSEWRHLARSLILFLLFLFFTRPPTVCTLYSEWRHLAPSLILFLLFLFFTRPPTVCTLHSEWHVCLGGA